MQYKRNLSRTIERNRKLWSGSFTSGVLAKIDIEGFSTMRLWEEVLSPKYCPDYKKMFEVFLKNYKKREFLLDDATPTARPNIGDSAFGAYLGAEVVFGETGGYSKPLVANLNEFKKLKYDEDNHWIKWLFEATKYFAEKSEGLFATSIVETMDSLNFAENLYGSGVYIEIADHPEKFANIFDFALEFNIKFIDGQRKFIKKHENGYFDLHEEWLPGECVWLSIDSWGNCSPEVFKKYGKYYLQKIIDHYGCGWLHMHNSHLHLLEEVSSLKDLVGIGILNDPKQEKCFVRLKDIQGVTRSIPLQISCEKEEFVKEIEEGSLCRNVMYWIESGVSSVKEANKLMEKVYNY